MLAAAAGVVVAHAAAYAAAFPSAAERGPHLDATGHGYWPVAVAAAVAAAGLALLLAAGSGLARGRGAGWGTVRGLAGWQVAAFAALEVGERAVNGVAPTGLPSGPEFWLGVVLQLPVALVAARLLHTAERTGARLASALRPRPWQAGPAAVAGPSPSCAPRAAARRAASRPRAPPLVPVSA